MMTLLYQIDASVAANLFADTGKTTAITDGTGVANAVPIAGVVTTDALQSTALNRPTYRSNYSSSGYAALEFDGSNDELTVAHSASFNVNAYDFVMVLTPINITGQVLLVAKLTNNSWNDGIALSRNGSAVNWGAPSYSATNVSGIFAAGTKILVWVRIKASNQYVYAATAGDVKITDMPRSGSAGSCSSTSPLSIGASSAAGGFKANFALHELQIHECTDNLIEFGKTIRTLENKWGINAYSSGSSAKPSHAMKSQVIG